PTTVRGLIAAGALADLARLAGAYRGRPQPLAGIRLGPPITDPGKIICVGLNYKGHAEEQKKPWPKVPLLFAKTANTLAGCADDIVLPDEDCKPDYEVELAVVIGARTRGATPSQAASAIVGYMVGNDVSARRWQQDDGQWFRAKSCDTFFPCGPALVTSDEAGAVADMRLTTEIAGAVLQDARASDLIHAIPDLIAYISRDLTLEPGDIISTGTPAGVGCWRTPPWFLSAGDEVVCSIAGLGQLRNRVVAAKARG
ncbi:MAG: fumarylacetoacetate hydrolase family protein, partial [Planctomycetes bacterium]|nr:fumarylacetoacetate hydrolase family protein [Planctomycetota bacterium]